MSNYSKALHYFQTSVTTSTPSGSGVDTEYAHIVDNTQATVTHDYKNLSVGTLNHYILALWH